MLRNRKVYSNSKNANQPYFLGNSIRTGKTSPTKTLFFTRKELRRNFHSISRENSQQLCTIYGRAWPNKHLFLAREKAIDQKSLSLLPRNRGNETKALLICDLVTNCRPTPVAYFPFSSFWGRERGKQRGERFLGLSFMQVGELSGFTSAGYLVDHRDCRSPGNGWIRKVRDISRHFSEDCV